MDKSDIKLNMKVRLASEHSMRGVIIALSSRKKKEEVIVEFEDGELSSMEPSSLEEIPPPDSKLEAEFENIANSIGEQIRDKLAKAEELLREACNLSDQYGIPFFTNVSLLGQPYVPQSFETKWSYLDRDFVTNLTEVVAEDLNSAYGWEHSQIC